MCSTETTLDRASNTCIIPVQSCSANCGMCSSSGNICYECLFGYYVADDFTCFTCDGVIPNCADCVNSTSCVLCKDGFILASNHTCIVPCHVPNCQSCGIIDICEFCLTGYTLDSAYNKCILGQSCIDPYCTDCLGDINICKACTPGYTLNSSGSCVVTMAVCTVANCETCNTATDIC